MVAGIARSCCGCSCGSCGCGGGGGGAIALTFSGKLSFALLPLNLNAASS